MANVLGIIAEYNPFHNGHLYHLNSSCEYSKADYTVAIITGHFTQRGDTSIVDKWTKAKMAILNGIDLVIELPTVYSISSAENFAYGAIKILDSLKIVNTISFGSESDISILNEFADVLVNEPKGYQSLLNHELAKGLSFPKARENALLMYLNDIRKYANVLSCPNNILGIEYLKAMKRLKTSITPFSVHRVGASYYDNQIVGGIASATAIRQMISNRRFLDLRASVPKNSYEILANAIQTGMFVPGLIKFEKEILYTFRKMSKEEIMLLPDVSEGLENSIKDAANSCNSIVQFVDMVKSKRHPATRIQRIAIYALLGITKKDMQLSHKIDPYVRVLGFSNKGKDLLSAIHSANPKLSIITSVKKFMDESNNKNQKYLLEKDIFATNVYTLGYEYDSMSNLDYTKKLVVL